MKSVFTAVAVLMFVSTSASADHHMEAEAAIETAETTLEVVAETEFAPVTDTYAALDADQSGTLSAEEAEVIPALTENWETLDIDASGELDAEEFAAFELVDEAALVEDQAPLEAIVEEAMEAVTAE